MLSRIRVLLTAAAVGGFAVLWMASGVVAQQPSDADKQADRKILEQDIYIPYEKLRQVFEKQGRGVFLPYEKFQELWRAAQEKNRPAAEVKPPVGALITEIENVATVEKDVVHVQAKLKIEVLAEGWNEIPLRLSDAAITSAAVAGQPARILGEPGQGYRLLIEKKGKQPEQIELALEYARVITRTPGQNSVSFQAPQAPVSRWRVVIPQAGVKVNLHPLIAATEVPDGKKDEKKSDAAGKKPDETVVLAFVGAAPEVRIDWTPKAEGATGLAAVASVQSQQQVWINEGVVRTRTTLLYSINRAELAHLTIDVPTDQKVVNVSDANVRSWSVAPAAGGQRITAELFEPAKSSQQVIVEMEKFAGEKAATVDVPMVKAGDVGRQQGVVVVQVTDSLRAEAVKTGGLLQVDAAELPGDLRGARWAFSYRYAAIPYELTLGIEKVQPQITVDSLVEAALLPDRLTLDLTAIYTIDKAGVFRLELDVPAGYDVQSVRGTNAAGAVPAAVDSHYLEGAKKTRLLVNLSRKAIGRVGLAVQLQKDLRQPELLTPMGKMPAIALPLPLVAPHTAERATGRLVISAPESLQITPEKTVGMRSISFREAYEGVKTPAPCSPTEPRPIWAFAYNGDEPVDLTFTAERRKPQVTIAQLMVVRVEEGVVKYDFTFNYSVLYSSVKSLVIDGVGGIADGLRITTPGYHETQIEGKNTYSGTTTITGGSLRLAGSPEPPPAAGTTTVPKGFVPDVKLDKGDIVWVISGETELMGSGQFTLHYEKPIEKLGIGKKVNLPMPYLKPRGVDRAWGQIVLVKSEAIDVDPVGELKSLRPIDPQHDLMSPVPSAARAFEFHDDWTLTVAATRYELEEIKRSSIELGLVRMVVTPGGTISVQALYRIRSARQRIEVTLPDKVAFDSQPLRVNGQPVDLGTGGGGQYFVPLSAANPDTPVVVELRYTLPGDGSRLVLPAFPKEAAIVKEYLGVYLPETKTLLGTRGPWTAEFDWHYDSAIQRRPVAKVSPEELLRRIRGDGNPSANAADDFQTDGRLYLYSTLRPVEGPDGALTVSMIDTSRLRWLVFGITVLLGLLLSPARLAARAVVVAAAVIGLVLAGVFLPTFSIQILDGVLAAAVFIVAVLWALAYAVRYRTKLPPSPPAAESPSPPASPFEPPKAESQEGGQANA
jgi:autotransporter-associated beta strand protein